MGHNNNIIYHNISHNIVSEIREIDFVPQYTLRMA